MPKFDMPPDLPEGFVLAHNMGFTTNHALNVTAKKTRCGLKWAKNQKGDVWVMNAAYSNAGYNCKRCFP